MVKRLRKTGNFFTHGYSSEISTFAKVCSNCKFHPASCNFFLRKRLYKWGPVRPQLRLQLCMLDRVVSILGPHRGLSCSLPFLLTFYTMDFSYCRVLPLFSADCAIVGSDECDTANYSGQINPNYPFPKTIYCCTTIIDTFLLYSCLNECSVKYS